MSIPQVNTAPAATAVLGAATIGSSAILIRLSGESPATVAFFRCAGALAVLAVLAVLEHRRRGPRSRSSHTWSLLAGVLLGITLVLQNHAIAALGAGIATVLSNLQVLFVALAGWALFAERPTRSYFLALPAALFGVLLVSGALETATPTTVTASGVLIGVLTSAAYAAFMLATKRGGRGGPPHVVGPLAEINLAAMGIALLYGLARGDFDPTPAWPAWGWLLLLALGPQLLGWFLITTSMKRLPIALTALILLLQPLVAVALSAFLLGERFSPAQLVGCAVLLAAVLFAGAGGRPASWPARQGELAGSTARVARETANSPC
ncbi:DMT family transporter [Pseudonocardia sp. CA-107938]|uniref:DMT family transporter n=1 Tax=Pseudonocardia sp. CA-107938 TaxID=3240021 RepID=UPI003D8F95EC